MPNATCISYNKHVHRLLRRRLHMICLWQRVVATVNSRESGHARADFKTEGHLSELNEILKLCPDALKLILAIHYSQPSLVRHIEVETAPYGVKTIFSLSVSTTWSHIAGV